jgi:glycosyltransferase involved in cell wall biosynthesis
LRILITNNTLADRAGSELYVRDLATALLDRGHTPIAYSTHLGDVAQELRSLTIPVIDHLDSLATAPDVIHGHHNLDLLTALLHFPGVPAICVCHGWLPWQEAPLHFPRVRRYVAVSQAVRDKLVHEHAIAEDRIRVVLNFVDLQRFKSRGPLPATPKRALVFSNYASEANYLGVVRETCARVGIAVDVAGLSSGNVCARPEDLLERYDLVFARGRCALEALAVGTAVILCDAEGAGPMVTAREVARLRSLNFGLRALTERVEPCVLAREIARYNAEDAAEASRWTRGNAGRDAVVEELIALYQGAIREQAALGCCDMRAEARAAADYLRWLAPLAKDGDSLVLKATQAGCERDQLRAEREALTQRFRGLEAERDSLQADVTVAQRKLDSLRGGRIYRVMRRLGRWKWLDESGTQ